MQNKIRRQRPAMVAGAMLALAALNAHADSNVTLYGVLNSGVIYVNNAGGNTSWSSSTGPSRWGLRGREDLGGGLSTIFTLENGFDPNSGKLQQGGREFGRQAFVGLSSQRLGTLTMGRQYDMVAQWLAQYTAPLKWNGYTAHPGDNDNTNFRFRVNNTAKYVSPDFNGLQFGAMYSFGGVAGNMQSQSAVSFGANYTHGPLTLSAAYLHMDHPAQAASEGSWTTMVFPAVSRTSPLNNNPLNPDSLEIYGAGGQYVLGKATFGLVWTRSKYNHLGDVADNLVDANVRFDNIEANASYFITPALQLCAAYTFTTGKVDTTGFSPKYHQVDLIANYFLSKRTVVYLTGIYSQAAGDASHPYIEYASNAASSTNRQLAITSGIFHRF